APSRYVGYLTLFAGCLLPPGALALWPIPTTLETGITTLKVSPSFYFDVQVQGAPADLCRAVAQAQYYLENDKLGYLVVGRGVNDTTSLASAKTLSSLTLSLTSGANAEPIASEAVKPLGTRREEYALVIPANGSTATLTANSTLGLYRGLTTFNQLFYYYGGPFQGLGLDTSRNYNPVADILRTLDAMSWNNTFHWHITDSQSFPLEVAQYPELAMNGAYSAEEVYTESDIQYIVQYAGSRGIDVLLRGIDVLLEIDTPGHTAIIGTSYPDYVACFGVTPWLQYTNEPPAGQLRFALPEVMNFTASLLVDIAKTLPSYYLSTGGDEVNTNCYANDYATQQQLNSTSMTLSDALDVFMQTTHGALMAEGKTPIVWE
ncbi:hypothetical protein AZE42_12470, partial [Rhizopogon vesiculosus]